MSRKKWIDNYQKVPKVPKRAKNRRISVQKVIKIDGKRRFWDQIKSHKVSQKLQNAELPKNIFNLSSVITVTYTAAFASESFGHILNHPPPSPIPRYGALHCTKIALHKEEETRLWGQGSSFVYIAWNSVSNVQ